MRLDQDSRSLLGSARIGMLALSTRPYPVVNPAAFVFSGDSVWMTTSRFAAKIGMARRDPRAAFMVVRHGRSVLLQGLLEAYDPRSPSSALRALFDGPRFALGMTGYALKNAAYIGGYMVDITGVPREWWPHNRAVLRLRVERSRALVAGTATAGRPDVLVGAPSAVARGVGKESAAILCWLQRGAVGPHMVPVLWAADAEDVLVWVPDGVPPPPAGAPAGVVVEYHHQFRATRMLGACPRGRLEYDEAARPALEERYQVELGAGQGFRLRTRRVTWWQGFGVGTVSVAATARPRS